MKIHALILAGALAAIVSGCASGGSVSGGTTYRLKAHEFEGCECNSVCPCIFSRDTSYGDCKVLMGWSVSEGHYKETDLAGAQFAIAITKSGANMEKEMGKWTGVLYLSDKLSDAQKAGIREILKAELGPAFQKVEFKTLAILIKRDGDRHELAIGGLGRLTITGIKNKAGQVTCVENAPSPLATPRMYCALSEVNSYDDGLSKWDLKGRNALFTDFDMASKD